MIWRQADLKLGDHLCVGPMRVALLAQRQPFTVCTFGQIGQVGRSPAAAETLDVLPQFAVGQPETAGGRGREEVLDQHLFARLDDVREAAWWWMLDYNEERPHDALGGMTPAERKAKAAEGSRNSLFA